MKGSKVSYKKADKLLRAGEWKKALEELNKLKRGLKVNDHAARYEIELRRAEALARSGKWLQTRRAAFGVLLHSIESPTSEGWELIRHRLHIILVGVLFGALKRRHIRNK